MKHSTAFRYFPALLTALLLPLLFQTGCRKKETAAPVVKPLPPPKLSEPTLPLLYGDSVVSFSRYNAEVGGFVKSQGGYPIVERGIYWSYGYYQDKWIIGDQRETAGSGEGFFSAQIIGLPSNNYVHYRTYAIAMYGGISYGEWRTLVLHQPQELMPGIAYGTVEDVDFNHYHTVKIGSRIWMVENLNTTRYSNRDDIKNNSSNPGGDFFTTFRVERGEPYQGNLYNSRTIMDHRGLAPAGWHVATVDDWEDLLLAAGGPAVAGGRLKTTDTVHWPPPARQPGTNSVGFSAVPCPVYWMLPADTGSAIFWATDGGNLKAFRITGSGSGAALESHSSSGYDALSVRCVKD